MIGDLIVTSNSTATIVVLANDDAYGVFNFSQPADAKVEEGSTVYYEYAFIFYIFFC